MTTAEFMRLVIAYGDKRAALARDGYTPAGRHQQVAADQALIKVREAVQHLTSQPTPPHEVQQT